MNTHFSSICPRVYGLDGYNHIDRKYTRIDALNADAENVIPSKSQPIYKNSNPMSESSSSPRRNEIHDLMNIHEQFMNIHELFMNGNHIWFMN